METTFTGVLILPLLLGTVNAAFLEMGIKGEDCGSTFQVHPRNEYTIKAYGDFAGSICSYTFMGQVKENCLGLCYNMNNESFFKDSAVELILQAGPHIQVFHHGNLTIGPWCSEELNMSVTLNVAKDYEFNNKNPGYGFSLEIYNKCGKERSMTFEEAVKHLEGYHHGEAFHENEYNNMVYGIVVGASLACVFLIILGITVLYYKRNRYRHRRMSKPSVTFKKKMQMVRQETAKRKSESEPEVTMKY